ncbi:MAG TPA: adenosyl-hopene transferase HpnH [Dehalococcoidia bacterium]|nr:adenosyl-hopene transferase HpnH [Dehalococcoidia bacterium]
MVFPWQLTLGLTRYLLRQRLKGNRQFPLVLMLEPLLRCNLACAGCGRIREYGDILDKMLSVEECLESVDECGAPVVSLTGGEPLIHPDIDRIVDGIVAKRRFVYLCTNGLAMEESLPNFQPVPYLSFVVHLDGLAQTHDRITGREGTFDIAIAAIKAAKRAGFQVRTNTTIYKGTDPLEIEALFQLLTQIGVDGIMVSPGFSYEGVADDVFLSREQCNGLFRAIRQLRDRVKFYNTPGYLRFLAGELELQCTPWSNPTRNPKGWKSPCYLITDGHYQSFAELMRETPWFKYGVGKDPRCANCMVHCGFEASAIAALGKNPALLWETVRWNFLS